MAKNRTNIKLIPSELTQEKLACILHNYNLPCQDFIADPHCTIIYSNDVVDVTTISLPPFIFPVIGKNSRFEFFDTMYDGIVLVIEFDCKAAEQCFNYVKQTYNISTRYSEYRAHITLQKNVPNKDLLTLPDIPFNLEFDKLEADNGE